MNGSLPTPPRRSQRRHEEGQGMVEYGLILALIAIVAILGLTVFGHATSNLYSNVASTLGT